MGPRRARGLPRGRRAYLQGRARASPGSYLLVYEISSLRVRDYYFPGQGQGMSEVAQALYKACGKQCEQVWNRLSELTTLIGFTDYYALVKK